MTRFILALLVIVPAILATEKQGRAYPLVSGSQGSGSAVGQFGQVQSGQEVHDKKNFGMNFNSDKGSSNQYSNTNAAVGLAGAQQQGTGYAPYPQYPSYPYPHYPSYPYPQYPAYQGYPTQAVGTGASITGYPGGVQNIQAGGGAVQGYPARIPY